MKYGPILIFEHGSWSPSSSGGCGVRHAHLHFVPETGHNVSEPPRQFEWRELPPNSWVESLLEAEREKDYLLYWPSVSAPMSSFVDTVESQTLRRHVAGLLGAMQWDWRQASATAVELAEWAGEHAEALA